MAARRLPARRPRQRRASAVPLLPMAAAGLLILAALQVGVWWHAARMATRGDNGATATPAAAHAALSGNPFVDMAKMRPFHHAAAPTPTRLYAPPLPQNVQFGNDRAAVTVTVLTDPSCGVCRRTVEGLLANVPQGRVRTVYKFWPRDPGHLSPGMMMEIARRYGVLPTFWRQLRGTDGDISDVDMLGLLADSGLSPDKLRQILTDEGDRLSGGLGPDIEMAQRARLPAPPVLLVDGYLLDGTVLQPAQLATYVQRRLDGEAITGGE